MSTKRGKTTSYDQLEISGETRTLKIEINGHATRTLHFDLELRIYDLYENPLTFFSPDINVAVALSIKLDHSPSYGTLRYLK